jgi:hypothetical protein
VSWLTGVSMLPSCRRRLTIAVHSLAVVAFREFSTITEETITTERKRFRAEIADEIESFSKRAAVRNLKGHRFTPAQTSIIYDKFFNAVVAENPARAPGDVTPPKPAQDDDGRSETRIDLRTFQCVGRRALVFWSARRPSLTA